MIEQYAVEIYFFIGFLVMISFYALEDNKDKVERAGGALAIGFLWGIIAFIGAIILPFVLIFKFIDKYVRNDDEN